MLERHLLVRHDLGQVLQELASSDYEALLQLIGLQIEVLLCKVEPSLDESEVEEGLLGRLDDPLFLLVEVLRVSLQVGRLLWHGLRRACLSNVLTLRDRAPADKEAIVVGVDNLLLLQDKDAVNRLNLFLFAVELVTHSLDSRGCLLRLLIDLCIADLSSSCLHALHRHVAKH